MKLWDRVLHHWCAIFGHAFDAVDIIMAELAHAAISAPDRELTCKVCKKTFTIRGGKLNVQKEKITDSPSC